MQRLACGKVSKLRCVGLCWADSGEVDRHSVEWGDQAGGCVVVWVWTRRIGFWYAGWGMTVGVWLGDRRRASYASSMAD